MLRKIFAVLVIAILPALAGETLSALAQAPMPAAGPTPSGLAVGVPKLPPIATPRNQQVIPVPQQSAPNINAPSSRTAPFEQGTSVLSLPEIFADQMSPTERVPP